MRSFLVALAFVLPMIPSVAAVGTGACFPPVNGALVCGGVYACCGADGNFVLTGDVGVAPLGVRAGGSFYLETSGPTTIGACAVVPGIPPDPCRVFYPPDPCRALPPDPCRVIPNVLP